MKKLFKTLTKKTAYQIDQSGKIEQTNRMTIVTLANGKSKTIKISSVEKQKLIKSLKELEHPRTNFIYKIFAVLIFTLIKNEKIGQLGIDKEYPGHESIIKDTLIYLYQKLGQKLPEINFTLVGKKCDAHKVGLKTFQKELKPDIIIKSEDVLQALIHKKRKKLEVSI